MLQHCLKQPKYGTNILLLIIDRLMNEKIVILYIHINVKFTTNIESIYAHTQYQQAKTKKSTCRIELWLLAVQRGIEQREFIVEHITHRMNTMINCTAI